MKTKAGIYLNIEESEYMYQYLNIDFYFSSFNYRQKFVRDVEEYIRIETQKIINKYNVNIDLKVYLALAFYKKIETRGYRVNTQNVDLSSKAICANVAM